MLAAAFSSAAERGWSIIARGGGCAYGDAATNSEQLVVDTNGMDRIIGYDPEGGVIDVEPGVPLYRIVDLVRSDGWVLPALPGSTSVTVGGAIAANIHGKDSFRHGGFGRCIASMDVMYADGSVKTLADSTSSEFRSHIGGMGLLGIVVRAVIKLVPAGGDCIERRLESGTDICDIPDALNRIAANSDYAYAWVDAFSKKGRWVIDSGRWAVAPEQSDLDPVHGRPKRFYGIAPPGLIYPLIRPIMGRAAMRAYNWRRFHSTRSGESDIVPFAEYYLPLTFRVPDYSSMFPGGALEAHACVPDHHASRFLGQVFDLCRELKLESWLCNVKKLIADDFLLSFMSNGFSISINLPGRLRKTERLNLFRSNLVQLVCGFGGRLNLSKDLEFIDRRSVGDMYPGTSRFLELKAKLDPDNLFQSDLSRRVFQPDSGVSD